MYNPASGEMYHIWSGLRRRFICTGGSATNSWKPWGPRLCPNDPYFAQWQKYREEHTGGVPLRDAHRPFRLLFYCDKLPRDWLYTGNDDMETKRCKEEKVALCKELFQFMNPLFRAQIDQPGSNYVVTLLYKLLLF